MRLLSLILCAIGKKLRGVSIGSLPGQAYSDNKTFKLYLPDDQELLGFNGTIGVEGRGRDL